MLRALLPRPVRVMKKLTFAEKVLMFLVQRLGTFAYRLVCSMYAMKVGRIDRFREHVRRGRPYIGICWHQRLFCVPSFARRFRGIAFIVSQSKDGQMITYVLEGLGFETVRGSSSRRGGRAMAELRDLLLAGRGVGITPDGPKGPGRQVQPGVARLSLETGAAVLPIAVSARDAWWAGGWDRFLFPKPLSEVLVLCGDPIMPPEGDKSEKALEEFKSRIALALDGLTEEADRRYRWQERRPRACRGLPEGRGRP